MAADFVGRASAPATYRVDTADMTAFMKAVRTSTEKRKLQREMREGFAAGLEPFQSDLLDAILGALPSGGGLSQTIHDEAKFTIKANSGRWAGLWVRIVAKSGASRKYRDLYNLLGRGVIRKPVFGGDHPHNANRRIPWVTQTEGTNPALITGAVKDAAPDLREVAEGVLEHIKQQIEKE